MSRNPNGPKGSPQPGSSDDVEAPLPFDTEAAPTRPDDPVVMLQISRDGGTTWSPSVNAKLGKIGEYEQRSRWFRQGSGRNIVLRFIISDPVPLTFLDLQVQTT